MTMPSDGSFTGKTCTQVDASVETSNAQGFTRPSFDGFGYQNESGSASGNQMGFPGGGDSVQSWTQAQTEYTGYGKNATFGSAIQNPTGVEATQSPWPFGTRKD